MNIQLGELVEISKGKKHEEVKDSSATPYIQIEDLTSSNTKKFTRDLGVEVNATDLIIAWDGANAGKVGTGLNGVIGSTLARLRIKNGGVNNKYLYRFLDSKFEKIKSGRTGATIPHVSRDALLKLDVPLPPLPVQQKIAAILDKADSLRQKDKQLLSLYDNLAQSVFYEMFGDNGQLEKKYPKQQLSHISEIVSGVTLNSKNVDTRWRDFPYLRVANVQDGYFDLSEIKYVKAPEKEFEKYVLRRGDILLTEGGDPDKLGRGTIWNNEIENCIHQNHIFRVRIRSNEFNPVFVSALMRSEYGKKYFFKAAKQTTGIASINSTQLKGFPVVMPPIALQNHYEQVMKKLLTLMQQAQLNVEKSEQLFQSLLQKAFKGELAR